MADHVTKQALDQLVSVLIAGATDAADRIYAGRITPFANDELPAINVTGGPEELNLASIHSPAFLERAATIEIACHTGAADSYDADAYALLKQVEHLVAANPTLSEQVKSIAPTAITWEREADAAVPVVRATLVLRAELLTMNNAVDVPV